jgi:2-polyprenyl-3-methyl-5-hydroxy-6-metoxy-1,4-benzoquinol methylase
MLAVQSDLLTPTVAPTEPLLSEELTGFDLVAICMALHHVEDISLVTKQLAEYCGRAVCF